MFVGPSVTRGLYWHLKMVLALLLLPKAWGNCSLVSQSSFHLWDAMFTPNKHLFINSKFFFLKAVNLTSSINVRVIWEAVESLWQNLTRINLNYLYLHPLTTNPIFFKSSVTHAIPQITPHPHPAPSKHELVNSIKTRHIER